MLEIESISNNLKLSKDGIWYSALEQDISYPEDEHMSCFEIEDASFWFQHRNDCIATLVNAFPPPDGGRFFDIGGGNGFVSSRLANEGFKVALVEPGQRGARNARKRDLQNVICATTETAQFKAGSLSAVGLFDVIEHIEDDLAFLQSIKALLKPDGLLYVTVPAYSFLWSSEDIRAGHFRRYSMSEIKTLLNAAGFKISFCSYIFRFLPLPIYLLRALPHKLGLSKPRKDNTNTTRDHATNAGIIAKLLNKFQQSELNALSQQKAMRFGGSCLLVVKNKE